MLGAHFESEIREQPDVWRRIAESQKAVQFAHAIGDRSVLFVGSGSSLFVGMLGALGFIIWLIAQSIFDLHTLCPWCMATWSVVIPTFWLVTLYNFTEGNIPLPAGAVRGARVAYTYVPLITLICYLAVFLIAQVQLDVINRF